MIGEKLKAEIIFKAIAEGQVPKMEIWHGGNIVTHSKLEYSEISEIFQFYVAPAVTSLKFKCFYDIPKGDDIRYKVYYETWDWEHKFKIGKNDPVIDKTLKITRKESGVEGIYGDGEISYNAKDEVDTDGDINCLLNDTVSQIVNKTPHIVRYYDVEHTIQHPGTYSLGRILSDLSDYIQFKEGYGLLRLDKKILTVVRPVGKRLTYITNSTVAEHPKFIEDTEQLNKSVYYGDDDFIPSDTETNLTVSKSGDVYKNLVSGYVLRDQENYNKEIGKVLKVENIFLKTNEINDYLAYRLKKQTGKKKYKLNDKIIDISLGDEVLCYFSDKDNFGGHVIGKEIRFGLENSRINYDMNIHIIRDDYFVVKDGYINCDTGLPFTKQGA